MRLFVAVHPGEVIAALVEEAIARLRPLSPGSKWVRADGAHITLAYLGEIEDARAPEVAAAVQAAARGYGPIELHVTGGSSFGKEPRPRVLWAGVTGEPAALSTLAAAQKDVERALTAFGYKPEDRAFTPHMTLARARDARGDLGLSACAEALRTIDFGRTQVSALTLYKSETAPGGARYTAVAEARLLGALSGE